MAAKKKARKKQARSKKVAGRRPKRAVARKKATARKKSSRKIIPPKKKAVLKRKPARKKSKARKPSAAPKKPSRAQEQSVYLDSYAVATPRARSGGQSGDLQGLSGIARANSESVDELLEEGNAFEADVVAGVEDAGNAEEGEVHTHEVSEDDIPEEYLEKDK